MMTIDDHVEPLVRAVLDAAVHRDGPRLEKALQAFPDDDSTRAGIELGLAITGFVLFDVHDGRPTTDQLEALATDISRQETWIGPTEEEVLTFLSTVLDGKPLSDVMPPESVIVLAYVVAANLLAVSSEPDAGEWWFNYLDKVEAAIERQ